MTQSYDDQRSQEDDSRKRIVETPGPAMPPLKANLTLGATPVKDEGRSPGTSGGSQEDPGTQYQEGETWRKTGAC